MTKRLERTCQGSHGLQTVFRVNGLSARRETTHKSDGPPGDTFHARKHHKKSRSGCRNCKRRRVKCDETRTQGGCLRCRHYGVACDYQTVDETETGSWTISSLSSSSTPAHRISPSAYVSTSIVPILYPSLSQPTPLDEDPPTAITPYLQMLRHFEHLTCPTITSPDGVLIFETSVLAIANENDYLMHAVLGTAAAHLAWESASREVSIEHRRHRQAEAYHWHKAISRFRSKIDEIGPGTTDPVDALISTCMLLGIHSYSVSDGDSTSFVWKPENQRAEALRWLSLQSGFGLLLRSLGGRASLSVWLEVFNSAVPGERGFQDDIASARGVYKDFLDLCMIDEHASPATNPYLTAIQDLFALLQMGVPRMANFAPLMAFMGRLVGEFQGLLVRRDPAALMIVAYWLALMDHLQLWWIQERARSECTAIVTFLQRTTDPRLVRLLEFPSKRMGIKFSEVWS